MGFSLPPKRSWLPRDRKQSVQSPCFVNFFLLTDAEDRTPSSLSTKPEVQSLHFIYMGKGYPWPQYLSETLKRGYFGPR